MRSIARRVTIGGLVLLSLVAASSNAAAQPQPTDTERARALFDEAGELERHGQWGGAQERLRLAVRLRETPQLYYALGWALENDDKLLEAKTEYETAVRIAGRSGGGGGNNNNNEEVSRLATTRLVELEKKMPIIKVRIAGAARSKTRVILDGREMKRGDDDVATAPVNPGSHVIRVERVASPNEKEDPKNATSAVEQMVYVGRSTVRTIDFDSREDVVASRDATQDRHTRSTIAPSSTTKRTAGSGKNNVLPLLLLSGGAALGAGSLALLLSAGADSDARDENQAKWCIATACKDGATATRPETAEAASYRRAASEASDTGNTKQAVGFALGGVGMVSAAVGAILLLRGDADERASERPATTSPTTRTRARASAAPLPGGGAYATASVTW